VLRHLPPEGGALPLSLPINWNYLSNSRVSPVSDSVRMFREILQVRLNDWRGVHDKGRIRLPLTITPNPGNFLAFRPHVCYDGNSDHCCLAKWSNGATC